MHTVAARRLASLSRSACCGTGARAVLGCGRTVATTAVEPPPPAPPPHATPAGRISSVDPAEVRKFSAMSQQWWNDVRGPFAALHRMNHVRVPLILQAVGARASGTHPAAMQDVGALPLAGVSICDVGCGGGILSEPLARLGADVTGIDAAPANIGVATAHAMLDPRLAPRLHYQCTTAEALAAAAARFDVVVVSEVLEHVGDVPGFLASVCSLIKPDGRLVITTLNRTARSFFAAIVGAEYVLSLVPPGTHEWAKFVTPHELQHHLASHGVPVVHRVGLGYNPISGRWQTMADDSVNYAIIARKAG